jgi:competence protein ComEC
MEVFFLDVGQGTSQVILLGGRRAIVVDCGVRNDRVVLHFLGRMGVVEIPCLIVSHSHEDHIGGAVGILGDYEGRIGKICFVQDDQFLKSAFWARISELLQSNRLTMDQLVRLEVTGTPQLVWSDGPLAARLRTFSPSAAENLLAHAAGKQNPTSAILFLDVGRHRLILAADSEVPQWREVRRKSGQRQECDVLSVPHHAGRAHSSDEELRWLLDEALAPKVAVISVGTSNTHGHPRPDVVRAMVARGIAVLCTQITSQCCDKLERLRPGLLKPVTLPGRSSAKMDVTSAGNSRNIACAGTVRAVISSDKLEIDRLVEHRQAVDHLASSPAGHPLCRATA